MSSMLSVFLSQLAGGCMLSVGLARVNEMSWKYLRLVSIVSVVVLLGKAGLQVLTGGAAAWRGFYDAGIYLGLAWLVINAGQRERVTAAQGVVAGFAGAGALAAALPQIAGVGRLVGIVDVLSGALLIGSATSAMLLGHRYLTDTGMTIAPLRRLTRVFMIAVAFRAAWVAAIAAMNRGLLQGGGMAATWNLMMLGVRFGVGVVGTAVFAYMVWDCVKRRSTQSATGILYLTMVFVFIGELTGQYLMRTAGLAV